MPIITLSNGLRIANFSSPHDFQFEDGTILKACSKERAEFYKVEFIEDSKLQWINNIEIHNIRLSFDLSDHLIKEIYNIMDNYEEENKYDIILIAMPMLVAIKENPYLKHINIEDSPFRVIKMKSRTEKVLRIDQFCV